MMMMKSYSLIYGSYDKESLIVMGNECEGKTCLNYCVSKFKENTIKKKTRDT